MFSEENKPPINDHKVFGRKEPIEVAYLYFYYLLKNHQFSRRAIESIEPYFKEVKGLRFKPHVIRQLLKQQKRLLATLEPLLKKRGLIS